MKRAALGIVAGATIYFVWGMISWMLLPWHNMTIKTLSDERLIRDVFKTVTPEAGLYLFPGRTGDARDPKVWEESYRTGPVGLLSYKPLGGSPMEPSTFIAAFIGDGLIAAIAFLIVTLMRERVKTLVKRTGVVASLGLLVWLGAHLPYWNWFFFPANYTFVVLADTLIGFALLGVVIGKAVPR